jgi:hypothetical protein
MPWTVRQQSGHRSCSFGTAGGAKLYASAAGALSIGEPPRPDLAQFVVIPQFEPTRQGAAPDLPSPRPFSSAPRVSGHPVVVPPAAASPRPHTAVGATAMAGTSAASSGPAQLVRLFHPPSRRFLYVNRETGVPSMLNTSEATPAQGATSPRMAAIVGLTFELLVQHASTPRTDAAYLATQRGRQRDSGGLRHGVARQTKATTLPVRAFDMNTGAARGYVDGALPPRWSAQQSMDALSSFVGSSLRVDSTAIAPGTAPESRARTYREGRGGRNEQGEAQSRARRALPAEDETRKTAWNASQLDLSDVMAGGPLVLRNLFACDAPPSRASCIAHASVAEPLNSRSRLTVPPSGTKELPSPRDAPSHVMTRPQRFQTARQ